MGKHLLRPQAPAVVGRGTSEGLVAHPSPWNSTDTLRWELLKPQQCVKARQALPPGMLRPSTSACFLPSSEHGLLSLPASPSAGNLTRPHPSWQDLNCPFYDRNCRLLWLHSVAGMRVQWEPCGWMRRPGGSLGEDGRQPLPSTAGQGIRVSAAQATA